ncbi:hypothetical protein DPMN_021488 [Dreissena polymorpha]|uniref:Uncharacterized protein n=1 Tax=Dreissena polymorpha TaxID=45954 RepID=A0A9D4SA04_DREPO|nr:hypothetical protein DPMN_021488 [Dreissena polymorpha]
MGNADQSLSYVVACLQEDNSLVETELYRHERDEQINEKRTIIHQIKGSYVNKWPVESRRCRIFLTSRGITSVFVS